MNVVAPSLLQDHPLINDASLLSSHSKQSRLSSDPHGVDDILHRANDRQRGQLSGLGILTGNILDVNVKSTELTFDFDVVAVTQESRNCKDADSGSIGPDAGEAYGR